MLAWKGDTLFRVKAPGFPGRAFAYPLSVDLTSEKFLTEIIQAAVNRHKKYETGHSWDSRTH
jgi:hypothetical protein